MESNPGGESSQKNWVVVYDPLSKALTIFMTKICDFPSDLIYELTKISITAIYEMTHTLFQTCLRINYLVLIDVKDFVKANR